ncbi:MAG: magnesium transporter, partial [Oscillospiraceae bacterium]
TSLIRQAADNDNITTIYAINDDGTFCGAIELRDLIVARAGMSLEDIIATSYPFLYAGEEIEECIEDLKDYSEDSIPVLDSDNHVIGVITATDIIEVVDTQMGEDYAMLAGLTEETDIDETVLAGAKKRIPWLIVLLGLSLIVSTVVGAFERVISGLTIIVSFQSVILGMSGNVGTQSLGVTLRVLISEEEMSLKEKLSLIFKEARIGLTNGFVLGLASTAVIGLYIFFARGLPLADSFLISGCVGLSLMAAMFISGAVGTAIPIILKSLKFDPAVASGPLITTCNDLVAVTVYYGLAWLLLIGVFNLSY